MSTIKFLKEVIDLTIRTVLLRPIIKVKGDELKSMIPDVNGFIFSNEYRLDIENYEPIKKDQDYTIVFTRYEFEIRDKDGKVVQKVKGQLISDDKL